MSQATSISLGARPRHIALASLPLLLLLALPSKAVASPWKAIASPSAGPAAAIGTTANGCLAGAVALPGQGPGYASVRRERNRFYGHPELLRFIADLGADLAHRTDQIMMVGDLAQPRGGRMESRHTSHQNGLDVDIWFQLAGTTQAAYQKTTSDRDPPSMVQADGLTLAPDWGTDQRYLLKAAAEDRRVERIFVNPAIKRALCESERGDRAWLHKVRPWGGHSAHFHVRLRCPAGDRNCESQAPLPAGDGCGAELAWWFSKEARKPAKQAPKKPEPMPPACQALLKSP